MKHFITAFRLFMLSIVLATAISCSDDNTAEEQPLPEPADITIDFISQDAFGNELEMSDFALLSTRIVENNGVTFYTFSYSFLLNNNSQEIRDFSALTLSAKLSKDEVETGAGSVRLSSITLDPGVSYEISHGFNSGLVEEPLSLDGYILIISLQHSDTRELLLSAEYLIHAAE